jgi:hypothetical protein
MSSTWVGDGIESGTRSLGTRTYPLVSSPWARPVDLWTLGGVANPLKDRCLSGVRFSNNEDSELDFWDFRKTVSRLRLLCMARCHHIPRVIRAKLFE